MTITGVQADDEGEYRCVVPDLRGSTPRQKSTSMRLRVAIKSQPVITSAGPKDGGWALTCDTGCWRPEPEVSWRDSEGNIITADSSVMFSDSPDCSAVQSNVTVRGTGQIICRVHHPHTNQTVEIQYVSGVVAIVGEEVVLPCHVEPTDMSNKIVEWSRPDLKPPLKKFVLIWRYGQYLHEEQNPWYKDRTSLFHEKLYHGNISLKLSRVNISDEGTYQCSVPELGSSSMIQLHVAQQVAVGGRLELLPDPSSVTVTGGITDILWKHGFNKLAEWNAKFGSEIEYYGRFKDPRVTLDKKTGMLAISNMKEQDSGTFSVRINFRPSKTYRVKVTEKTIQTPPPTNTTTRPAASTDGAWKIPLTAVIAVSVMIVTIVVGACIYLRKRNTGTNANRANGVI